MNPVLIISGQIRILIQVLLWGCFPLLARGQSSNVAVNNYIGNYYAALNNLGDVSYQMDERRAFREDMLNQYFLYEGSVLWNDLRPRGTEFIRPREYLDIVITDFPRGVIFTYEIIEVGAMQPTSRGYQLLIRIKSTVKPAGSQAFSNEVKLLLDGQSFTGSSLTARIKSIDRSTAAINVVTPGGGDTAEEAYWEGIKAGDTESGYRSYLNRYENGKYASEARKRIADLTKPTVPAEVASIAGNMVRVSGGTFTMGCTSEQGGDCYDWEKPAHQVTLSPYEIGKYEVTQAEWRAVMGTNPSNFSGCGACAVEQVSWNDVQEFLGKLNGMTNGGYRLPTESEWEYAARGGSSNRGYKYAGGNDLGRGAWYDDNSGSKTHPVGQKQANELGLYDMSGNVWEWCSDWDGDYASGAQTNPNGPSSGTYCVIRGGGWGSNMWKCRVSSRNFAGPTVRNYELGFRLARSSNQ